MCKLKHVLNQLKLVNSNIANVMLTKRHTHKTKCTSWNTLRRT